MRWGLVSSNGRMTTRLLVGFNTMPVRRTFSRARRFPGPSAMLFIIGVLDESGRARQSIRIHVSLAPDLGVKRSVGSVTRGNRLIHMNLAESRQATLQQFHFAQGQQKGQG